MSARSPELKLAEHLAAPFARPGERGKPLSYRLQEDGGMVVISADGRKLWFTLEEANAARRELGMKPVPAKKPPPPPPEEPRDFSITSAPPPRMREGYSEAIALPPELKHIEEMINGKNRRH
jgi:hypothetical protein